MDTSALSVLQQLWVIGCLLGGTFFMVVTGIGLVRFPDVYCRMHAAGKAGTLGVAMLILAAAVFFADRDAWVSLRGVLAIIFQCLTTPGATYLLAHACYATNHPSHDRTDLDELKEFLPAYPPEDFGRE